MNANVLFIRVYFRNKSLFSFRQSTGNFSRSIGIKEHFEPVGVPLPVLFPALEQPKRISQGAHWQPVHEDGRACTRCIGK